MEDNSNYLQEYEDQFGIDVENLFKFNSSHFVVYENFRETLHGHNYLVSVKLKSKNLNSSYYVLDFDIVKAIMTEICKGLHHCLLLPELNPFVKLDIDKEKNLVKVNTEDSEFSFPLKDVVIVKTEQISAECMAKFITKQFLEKFKEKYPDQLNQIRLKKIVVKVSESKGKSGVYYMKFK